MELWEQKKEINKIRILFSLRLHPTKARLGRKAPSYQISFFHPACNNFLCFCWGLVIYAVEVGGGKCWCLCSAQSVNLSLHFVGNWFSACKCFSVQLIHMGWVYEHLHRSNANQVQSYKFLALKGSSLYILRGPPVSPYLCEVKVQTLSLPIINHKVYNTTQGHF